ncbi:ABC transporter permease, partial [Pseudomonas aeruginosa]
KGVLFTYGTNYEALGRQTGKLAGRVLRGEKVKDIDAEYPKTLNVVVNHDMAKELGIDVSSISDEESKVSTKDDKPIAKKDKGVIKLKVNKSSKNGFSNVVLTSISQGLLWAIMAIGVFITFRILDLADLTAEGTFPLGAATTTIMIIRGINPIFATLGGFVAGMFAGAESGFMHTKMKIPALLTGIITLTGLYSVNLLVLGSANISLSGH